MPTFTTEVAHQLGQEQATERLKQFLDHVREQYKDFVTDLQGNWTDNILTFSLKTYGFKIDGILTVEDQAARLAGNLPFAALAFRGKIEQSIASELRRELG
ncbi:MAG: polyhydroxyalkanoic acid system family protein [Pirellulaceae bacterium]